MVTRIEAIRIEGIATTQRESIWRCLGDERRRKIVKYVREVDQLRSLMAEVLARTLIQRYWGIASGTMQMGVTRWGKPVVISDRECHFNLSHSGEWVVCAVSHCDIGIDVERIAAIGDFVVRYFTKEEQMQCDVVASGDHRYAWCRQWTLKESYLKAVGYGLYRPMNSFSVLEDETGQLMVLDERGRRLDGFIKVMDFDEDYALAVCTREETVVSEVTVTRWAALYEEFRAGMR